MCLGRPAMEEGCGQCTPQCAPHIQGLRSPPEKKIASAAVITTRSNRALSSPKSTTEAKKSASTRIRVTLAIVVVCSPSWRFMLYLPRKLFQHMFGENATAGKVHPSLHQVKNRVFP